MDYLSRCYRARVRPYRDSDAEVIVRWYYCKPGAKIFPLTHLFGSQVWRENPDVQPDGPGERFGPKPFDPGYNPGYVGQCHVGPDDWFTSGVPVGAVTGAPPVLPACCFVLGYDQLGAAGGWTGFSLTRPPPRWGSGGGWAGAVQFTSPTRWGGVGGWTGSRSAYTGDKGGWSGLTLAPSPWGGLGGWTGHSGVGVVGLWGGRGGYQDLTMAPILCQLQQLTTQSIPNTVGTAINWDTVVYDPYVMWHVANPERIVVPVDGVYLLRHQMPWNGLAVGTRNSNLLTVNGFTAPVLWDHATTQAFEEYSAPAILKLTAGDIIRVITTQYSGAAKNTYVANSQYAPSVDVACLAATPQAIISGTVYQTVAQSIANNTRTALLFDTVVADPHGMWNVAHKSRLVAPQNGTYLVTWCAGFSLAANASWESFIGKNGAAIFAPWKGSGLNGQSLAAPGSYVLPLVAGDYVEIIVWHNAGSAQNTLVGADAYPFAQLTWLGPTG